MKSLYIRSSLFFSFICLANFIFAEPSYCPEILNSIETSLPHYGVLKEKNGFFYLDLPDDYIYFFTAFMEDEGFFHPPYFGKGLVGAHITVISKTESNAFEMTEVQECGQSFSFHPLSCEIVHPLTWSGVDSVYLITVESKELDLLREKYGLAPSRYPFHITIGIKKNASPCFFCL